MAMQAPAAPVAPAAAVPDGGVAMPPKPEKVKIYFFTVPQVPTELRWGKKKLGIINPQKGPKKPFFIERLKDSGPLDVVARSDGFLPLNTRVYTYADGKIWLKLTPEEEKHKVLGYKQALPDGGPDGGVADGGVLMPGPGAPMPLQPAPNAPGPMLGPPPPPGPPAAAPPQPPPAPAQ